jgi:rhodanese-related sulfurtransferase
MGMNNLQFSSATRAVTLTLAAAMYCAIAHSQSAPSNPRIDMPGYLQVAHEAAQHREARRLSEQEFQRMSAVPGTIVLDARSSQKYKELHIDGAVNLSFPDITVESLAALIPDKNTRVLIYCNNNFSNAERAFPTKLPSASLNISTYIALYNHGYRNVYELAPLIDAKKTGLKLVSS